MLLFNNFENAKCTFDTNNLKTSYVIVQQPFDLILPKLLSI